MNHKEKPLAELTLRKYEKPYRLSGRDLIKKLCLSIGLLQPADGRDAVVDVFMSVLKAPEPISLLDIERYVKVSRKTHNLSMNGIASSNIRRQVKRLKDAFIVEKLGNGYRIAEDAPLQELFAEKIEKFYLPVIVARVKEYCEAVEQERWKHGCIVSEVQKSDE